MRVSNFLTYREVTKSFTAIKLGIDNTPNNQQLENIKKWGREVFDPIRNNLLGKPLGVHSVFRSKKLNDIIGKSNNSQHLANNGAAGDIDADIYGHGTNEEIFRFILEMNIPFDQLILEGLDSGRIEWIHVSHVGCKENRKEILMMYKKNGKVHYEYYTPERYSEIIDNARTHV